MKVSIPAKKLKYISHQHFSISDFNLFMASQLKSKIRVDFRASKGGRGL